MDKTAPSKGRKDDNINSSSDLFKRLAEHLDECRINKKTITYLEAADAIGVVAPLRIHQITQLLEIFIEHDLKLEQPIRAALVVSRDNTGLPGEGFFLKAQELGLMNGVTAEEFHQHCLNRLLNKT